MKRILPVSVVVLVLQVSLLAHAVEPANPQTNAKARAILNYLEKLPQRTDKRLVSGQFTDFGPAAKLTNCQDAFDKTGHWPAMIGIDYAGDRYVDLIGLDAYTDFIDPQHIKGYDEIIRLPKPFGFTEFGPHGPQKPPGDYDYLRFIDGVQKNFPKATFFLAWHWNWGLGRNQNTKQLLEHPWTVNREDLPPEFAASSR